MRSMPSERIVLMKKSFPFTLKKSQWMPDSRMRYLRSVFSERAQKRRAYPPWLVATPRGEVLEAQSQSGTMCLDSGLWRNSTVCGGEGKGQKELKRSAYIRDEVLKFFLSCEEDTDS
jgi:hypothetical protein